MFELTGHDEGRAAELWFNWWNDHKKDFTVPAEAPELPKIDAFRWNSYWGIESAGPKPRKGGKHKARRDGEEPKGRD
ncbi:MAG: hypothetical protein K8S98_14705 [Planctomycetes bacterium]|nr:hypothetical protein [Planctomycetota bacterium]